MRLDRFITLNLVQPWRRALRSINPQPSTLNSQSAVPILMYHSISDDPEPDVSPYYRVNTSPSIFREHMAFLKEQGYQTISLDQLVSAFQLFSFSASPKKSVVQTLRPPPSSPPVLQHSTAPSPRLVCITFDDGFRDFYTQAFPILQQHGFTATVFLPTAFIGDERRRFEPLVGRCQPSTLNPQPSTAPECLTWNEVKELHEGGTQIGSHTANHPKLMDLGWDEIESELRDSKSEMENRLGVPAKTLAYPYAFPQPDWRFTSAFRDLLRRVGYASCVTTEIGSAQTGHDAFQLPRLPVNSDDDAALFGAKLVGNYDWLAFPQAVVKKIKHAVRPARKQTDAPVRTLIPRPPAAASSPALTTKQP